MKRLKDIYPESFFDATVKYEQKSAPDVARIIYRHFRPDSVIDIGCGCGIHLKALVQAGVRDVRGYDGSSSAIRKSLLPQGKITVHDLRKPLKLGRRWDLCLCIEVAEHISNRYAPRLVTTLTALSDTVFFTAATPGQGGRHHVNERPFSSWIRLFRKKGFVYRRRLTAVMRREMEKKKVVFWIAKNLMIFERA